MISSTSMFIKESDEHSSLVNFNVMGKSYIKSLYKVLKVIFFTTFTMLENNR